MLKKIKNFLKRPAVLDPKNPVHIDKLRPEQYAHVNNVRIRVTVKAHWPDSVKLERLDKLARSVIGPNKVVAHGDLEERPIVGTEFHACYRDYYIKV